MRNVAIDQARIFRVRQLPDLMGHAGLSKRHHGLDTTVEMMPSDFNSILLDLNDEPPRCSILEIA